MYSLATFAADNTTQDFLHDLLFLTRTVCAAVEMRAPGFHLPGCKWSTWSHKAALSLSIHRAQGPDGYVRRRLSRTSGRDEARITQSRRCKALLSAPGPGLFIMC